MVHMRRGRHVARMAEEKTIAWFEGGEMSAGKLG